MAGFMRRFLSGLRVTSRSSYAHAPSHSVPCPLSPPYQTSRIMRLIHLQREKRIETRSNEQEASSRFYTANAFFGLTKPERWMGLCCNLFLDGYLLDVVRQMIILVSIPFIYNLSSSEI